MNKHIILGLQIICVLFVACNNSGSGSDPELSQERPYKAGDIGPCGGIIFYDDTLGFDFDEDGTIQSDEKDLLDGSNDGFVSGRSFLEAASPLWNGSDDPDPEAFWGLNNINTMVPDISWIATADNLSNSVGKGKSNTEVLITALTNEGESGRAAQLCINCTAGGRTDWFLPSMGELYLMYKVLHCMVPPSGSFGNSEYLSSSEYNDVSAVLLGFINGNTFYVSKTSNKKIRPVRSF